MGNVLARLKGRSLIDGGQDKEICKGTVTINTTPPNYNQKAVSRLIKERRLAPFYPDDPEKLRKRLEKHHRRPLRGPRNHKKTFSPVTKEWLTTDMIECPICFSTYPRNINRTCCCNQPICTLCFVNLRMHNNRRICCPYCNKVALGVLYDSPQMMMAKERGAPLEEGSCNDNLGTDPLKLPTDAGIINPNSNTHQSANFYYVRRPGMASGPQNLVNGQNRQRQDSYRGSNPYRPPASTTSPSQAEHPSHRSYYYYQYSMSPFQ